MWLFHHTVLSLGLKAYHTGIFQCINLFRGLAAAVYQHWASTGHHGQGGCEAAREHRPLDLEADGGWKVAWAVQSAASHHPAVRYGAGLRCWLVGWLSVCLAGWLDRASVRPLPSIHCHWVPRNWGDCRPMLGWERAPPPARMPAQKRLVLCCCALPVFSQRITVHLADLAFAGWRNLWLLGQSQVAKFNPI